MGESVLSWKILPSQPRKLSGLKSRCERLTQMASSKGSLAVGGSTTDNIRRIEELVLSQESLPGTHQTVCQIAQETEISRSLVFDIIQKDLKLKCFEKKWAQDLTETNKLSWLVYAKQLLKRYPKQAVNFIWFSDEKVFMVAPLTDLHNDRACAASETKKK